MEDHQPSSGVVQPSSGEVEPSSGEVEPSSGVVQPSSGVVQPSSGMVQPSSGVVQPSSGVVQPSSGMVEPSTCVIQPSSGVFRRKEKWKPVYAWLESMDTGTVVGARMIENWLESKPLLKEDLLGQHTRHHLFHYIQKLHTSMIKKKMNQGSNSLKISIEVKKKKKKKKKPHKLPKLTGHASARLLTAFGCKELSYCGKKKSQGSFITANGDIRRPNIKSEGTSRQISSALWEGSDADFFIRPPITSIDKAEAKKRYEILSVLRGQLLDHITKIKEHLDVNAIQRNVATTAQPNSGGTRPCSSGANPGLPINSQHIQDDSESRLRRRSRDGVRSQQENWKFLKKRKKGKDKFHDSILSWSYGEVITGSPNGREDKHLNVGSQHEETSSSDRAASSQATTEQGVQKVLDVRFHPRNLPQIVCSSNAAPNELLLYDLLSGKALELAGHNCQIQAVEYAGDGAYIVSCGANLVKIWDSMTGECLHTLGPNPSDMSTSGHRRKINALAVNLAQSYQVATSGGNGDSQILLWNVNRGELTCDLNANLRNQSPGLPCMDALEFCGQNSLICGSDSSGGPAIVQIWDVQSPDLVSSFPANDSYITSLKANPSGTVVAAGAGDGSVGLFDIKTGGGIVRLPLGSNFEVTSVSFSSCGTYLQASSTSNRTFVWDMRMLSMDPGPMPVQSPLKLADIISRKVRALHCLSHGVPMPTSENAGQMPGFVDEGDEGINDARWFHDKSILVTASGNGSIAMWDMSLGDPCVRHMISHTRCVNTIAISPDDRHMCSGGDDQKVVLYNNTWDKSAVAWRLTHPLVKEQAVD